MFLAINNINWVFYLTPGSNYAILCPSQAALCNCHHQPKPIMHTSFSPVDRLFLANQGGFALPTILFLLGTALIVLSPQLHAQLSITTVGVPVTENFDSLGIPTGGAAQQSTLPANWRVDAFGDSETIVMRTLGTWAGAGTSATRNGGENLGNTNAIYNFGSPTRIGEDSGDRAIGFYGNNSGTHSGNLYAWFTNDTGSDLTAIDVVYDVENYRDGTVSGGTRFQLYHGSDGVNWTSAGSGFETVYSGAEAVGGFDPAPGATVTVTGTLTFTTPIADGDSFYLAWNYSNATAASPGAAYALAIDNFSLTAIPEPSTMGFILGGLVLTIVVIRRRVLQR